MGRCKTKNRGHEKLFLLHAIFLQELLNSAFGIDKFLLAGEEWVTARTDFDMDRFFGRSRVDNVAAGASDRGVSVFRMDSGFHFGMLPRFNILNAGPAGNRQIG